MAAPRGYEERRAHALKLLKAPEADAWVATASADGVAHMVPLSIGWAEGHIVLVTESRSVTARNLRPSSPVRLGLGGLRDVVMIVAEVVGDHALDDSPDEFLSVFTAQSGWDPRGGSDAGLFRLFVLRPVTVQAWREANEITGRTLMKDGEWLAVR